LLGGVEARASFPLQPLAPAAFDTCGELVPVLVGHEFDVTPGLVVGLTLRDRVPQPFLLLGHHLAQALAPDDDADRLAFLL
jgi:hypothetical protein